MLNWTVWRYKLYKYTMLVSKVLQETTSTSVTTKRDHTKLGVLEMLSMALFVFKITKTRTVYLNSGTLFQKKCVNYYADIRISDAAKCKQELTSKRFQRFSRTQPASVLQQESK